MFEQLSAIFSGVRTQESLRAAPSAREQGKGTLLFIDEIHRFNRAQQDSFLPHMEDGTITLVGATTENPSFELNGALLSRARCWCSTGSTSGARSAARARRGGRAAAAARWRGARGADGMADGDGRALLNMAEEVWRAVRAGGEALDRGGAARGRAAPRAALRQVAGRPLQPDLRAAQVGARLRSRRGALLARAHARRRRGPLCSSRAALVRMAIEDIGLADPQALVRRCAAKDAFDFLGSPEGELALAQATVYLATAPKSNAVYIAVRRRMRARQGARLAGAAQEHPQRADQADEAARATAPATI